MIVMISSFSLIEIMSLRVSIGSRSDAGFGIGVPTAPVVMKGASVLLASFRMSKFWKWSLHRVSKRSY